MFIIILLLVFPDLYLAKINFDVELEPNHSQDEYESMEEVKGHFNETTTEPAEEETEDLKEAILDVAYYLRRFKFNGYDPRFLAKNKTPERNLYIEFPTPPLRTIHWEVKKNCEPSFVECVKYLQEQVSQTVLPRHLDSLTITRQNGWSLPADESSIKATNEECLKLLESDEKTFIVFSGPLQRFQWLTSASYFMCHYTMKEVNHLEFFTEDCDNYAACIDFEVGLKNGDVRGKDSDPFACAAYSFCPDPCCPLKNLNSKSSCLSVSPCAVHSSSNQTCTFSKSENVNFDSIVTNEWNISCHCDLNGSRWESKSGMCVDIDECREVETACDFTKEICKNLPGGYKCLCNPLGYRKASDSEHCEDDPIMKRILFLPQNVTNETSISYLDKIRGILTKIRSYTPGILKNFTIHAGNITTEIPTTTKIPSNNTDTTSVDDSL